MTAPHSGAHREVPVGRPAAPLSRGLGLALWAHLLDRDLQAAARRAGGPEALWRAEAPRLAGLLRVGAVEAAGLVAARRGGRPPAIAACARGAVAFLEPEDALWPGRLAPLIDAPFGLFVCGQRSVLAGLGQRPVVAVVGSRRSGPQARLLAHDLAHEAARRGAVIVSGLALGIDAAAHQGALDAGGTTIAVLGCGVDIDYPRRHRELARRIAATGALLSEYWPGTRPAPWRFPARNRIVAGLADAVAVVEAGARSGALITADFALELGRPVLAVPGWPTLAGSAGGNALLRVGAALLEGVDDLVDEIPSAGWREVARAADEAPSGLAAAVMAALGENPRTLDGLVEALDEGSAAEIGGALALLEVEGRVVRGEGRRYWPTSRAPAAGGDG